ncbi:MAG: hypothetical protein GF308_22195 [Candidatus Heimdallarchaeota archaeon]|nr:hypothetical protein [Candidatus Heimdallarchaeota archaeon]
MIALTKETQEIIREIFNSQKITEIKLETLLDLLDMSHRDFRKLLRETDLGREFKLVQAADGTFFVKRFFTFKDGESLTRGTGIKWDTIGGCPCFTCPELERCDIGNNISSLDCPLFSRWLFADKQKKKEEKEEAKE